MTPIPSNLYDMPAVTLKELRGYVAEVWAGRNWTVWLTTEGRLFRRTFTLHIGGTDAQGNRIPAESYHGRNRQQAMFRARVYLVALLQRGTLQTFGYGIEGLNALRGRMGLDLLEVGSVDRKSKKRRKSDEALQRRGARVDEGKRRHRHAARRQG